jgi:hypothetical protein
LFDDDDVAEFFISFYDLSGVAVAVAVVAGQKWIFHGPSKPKVSYISAHHNICLPACSKYVPCLSIFLNILFGCCFVVCFELSSFPYDDSANIGPVPSSQKQKNDDTFDDQ